MGKLKRDEKISSNGNKKSLSFSLVPVLLAAILLLGIFLRMPTLSDLSCDPDLSGIRYTGQGLTQGLLPYRDSVESKPPGAYFLAAISLSLFGQSFVSIYLFALLWIALTAMAIFTAAKILAGVKAGLFASLLFSLFSTLRYVDGLCPNYEIWVLLPMVLALIYGLKSLEKGAFIFAGIAGVMASAAVQIKLQAIFPAFTMWLFLVIPTTRRPRLNFLGGLSFIAGGFLAVIPLVVFYTAHRALGYLVSHFLPSRTVSYASENSLVVMADFLPNIVGGFIQSAVFLILLSIIGAVILIASLSKASKFGQSKLTWLFLSWLAGCLFAVFFLKGLFSAALFARHYFLLLIPALCIAGGVGLKWLAVNRYFRFQLLTVTIIAAIWLGLSFSPGFVISTDALFEFAELKSTDEAFIKSIDYTWLDKSALRPVGEFLNKNIDPKDTIYVWDYVPSIYSHAQARAPSRHYKHWEVVTTDPWGHYFDPSNPAVVKARRELMEGLIANPPKFIVAFKYYGDYEQRVQTIKNDFFPELMTFVEKRYELVEKPPKDWDPLLLYRLRVLW